MQYHIKMLAQQYRVMRGLLMSNPAVEQGCFLLCSQASLAEKAILLVKDIIQLNSNDLLLQKHNILSVKPEVMLRVARLAERRHLSVCMVHTHPLQDGPVDFSYADDLGNARSFAFFNRLLPFAINSCLVWDGNITHVAGRVYRSPTEWYSIQRIDVLGEKHLIRNTPTGDFPARETIPAKYDRQARLLGDIGQEILSSRRIAIVGAGGIGSCIGMILAHSGAGALLSIDMDYIKAVNLPRTIDAIDDDVTRCTPKTEVLHRYVKRINPDCDVRTYKTVVEDPDITHELISADYIICATDNTRSRAFLNQLCQQYYIPLLDLGVQFTVDQQDKTITNEIGRINLILPGTPCLLCSGHIHPDRMRLEALTQEDREQLQNDGYIRGIDIPEPSMMPFNMEIAARGAQVLIGHITGLYSADPFAYERISFFGSGGKAHYKLVRKHSDSDCMFCSPTSDYFGGGDPWHPITQNQSVVEIRS